MAIFEQVKAKIFKKQGTIIDKQTNNQENSPNLLKHQKICLVSKNELNTMIK